MTREDIIGMAREAGGFDSTSHGWTSWGGTQSTHFLERFAALVAAAERDWVINLLNTEYSFTPPQIVEDIRARGQA